ncbi:MAG TPA: hypothetical protein VG796_07315 [Verrucomicrobiales bacterium]|jgi:hypothetical protein|nr:hypothetical protein [Verrucomicrobiales bacterium]
MIDDPEGNPVRLHKAGVLRWGAVSQTFAHGAKAICILIDHDGTNASGTWRDELSELERRWPELREALDEVLPGGMSAATLQLIDLRSHIRPGRAVLDFKTTHDEFAWFVRLGGDYTIEIAGPKD